MLSVSKDKIFVFYEVLYERVDGAPIGGLVSPVLANYLLAIFKINGSKTARQNLNQFFTNAT